MKKDIKFGVAGSVLSAIVVGGIAVAALGGCTTTKVVHVPGPTVTKTVPGPAKTVTAPVSPAPAQSAPVSADPTCGNLQNIINLIKENNFTAAQDDASHEFSTASPESSTWGDWESLSSDLIGNVGSNGNSTYNDKAINEDLTNLLSDCGQS